MTVLVSTHYMDEAERCHRVVYIAVGRLLIHGGVDEVIDEVGPHHLRGRRAGAGGAARRKLRGQPGVEMIAAFGASLHVSGTDAALLERSIAPFRADPQATAGPATRPSLEDVFIHTLARAEVTHVMSRAPVLASLPRRPDQGIHPDAARPPDLRA